jgi:hypothetical protein
VKDLIEGIIRQLIPLVLTKSVVLNLKDSFQSKVKEFAADSANQIDDAAVAVLLSDVVVKMVEDVVIEQLGKITLETDTSIDDLILKIVKDALK